ncbi:GNAT family N-acetyltransferase [Thiomicrorhabdus sp. Milos-T2]|uniref:GNAT family N-acetyltransferase n=1 Tax=Thiomicrorhabdus sp. Milos-T2 TaxID=90814 RepID=UPI000493E2C9|nr:GNAT family N-acetyltransferase [Thiomicrorhabdus sp. Milos-T2]
MGKITEPTGLNAEHDISSFDCGYEALKEWLQEKALKNHRGDASRCFVICDNNKVVGYYAFSNGSVEHNETPGALKRNMPNPIPVLVMGRLAIDKNYQGQSFGKHLLKDCLLRSIAVSEHVAFKALMIHAIDEKAKEYYLNLGFAESPTNDLTVFLPMKQIRNDYEDSFKED